MQALTFKETVAIACVYVVVVATAHLLGSYTKTGDWFFKLFVSSPARIVATTMMMVTCTSVSLFYMDWVAWGVVPIALVTAAALVVKYVVDGKLSVSSGLILVSLVAMIGTPTCMTLAKRDEMSEDYATVVGVAVAAFWIIGAVFTATVGSFRQEVNPQSKTRTLLLLLGLSMYSVMFASKKYAVPVMLVLGGISSSIWMYGGSGEKLFSVALDDYKTGYQAHTAFIVTSMLFAAILNFTLVMRHKEQARGMDESLYVYNICLFAVALTVFVGIVGKSAVNVVAEGGGTNLDTQDLWE